MKRTVKNEGKAEVEQNATRELTRDGLTYGAF